jgi:hypothetical protein
MNGDENGPDNEVDGCTADTFFIDVESCSCPACHPDHSEPGCTDCKECVCLAGWGNPLCDAPLDCMLVPYGNATDGVCGCNVPDEACVGCDGVKNSGKEFDLCGYCDGHNRNCSLCDYDCSSCIIAENCHWCQIEHEGEDGKTTYTEECQYADADHLSDLTCYAIIEDPDKCGVFPVAAIVGITAAGVVLLIVGIIVAVAVLSSGTYLGVKYWSKYKSGVNNLQSNPMYEAKTSGEGVNPFYNPDRPN